MGVETTLSDRGIKVEYDSLKPVLASTLKDPDMDVLPYAVTDEMIYKAIVKMEEVFGGNK